jgi:hypothetical protein
LACEAIVSNNAQLFDLLFAVVIALNVLDAALTVRALATGKAAEGNPVMRWAMSLLGVEGALMAVKWALVVYAHLKLYGTPMDYWRWPMVILLGAFGAICVSNIVVIWKIKRKGG